MGMRNPELPENRRLSLNYTPPAGPVEPVESSSSQVSTAAIYARVNASWKDGGISLESQVEKCRTLLEAEGYRTSKEFIYQEVRSGVDKERPELARLIADVRAGKVRAVYVHDMDRWSRDPIHSLQLFDELLGHDVQLRPVNGTLEDTTEGRLIHYVRRLAGQQGKPRLKTGRGQ